MPAPQPRPGLRRPHPLDDPAPTRVQGAPPAAQALNAKIPAALHRRLRVAAAEDGRTVVSVVVEALTGWLDRRQGGR
jgi:hypothetical protein